MRANKTGPPGRPASKSSRDRHKPTTRQQFYTNNEESNYRNEQQDRRSDATTIRPTELYQFDLSSPLDNGQRGNLLSGTKTPFKWNKAHASEPAGSRSLLTNGNNSICGQESGNVTSMLAHHDSGQFMVPRDCVGPHSHISATGSASSETMPTGNASSLVCDDSQLSIMNIRPEETNFSDLKEVWLVKSWQEILLRVAFVAPIVLLGILGNATIIYSMCRFKPIRSKPTNIFILNMALADLLTTIVCPNAALLTDIYQFYVLGSFVCRTEGFIKITCLLVSAYSLIMLSFDWFLSVVKPCRTRITITQSWFTLASIWLISVAMATPLLFSRQLRERQWLDITEVWCCELIQYTKYYWVCITLFLIYLPTFVMTIVLVVILAKMDEFEAKLRRSRCLESTRAAAATTMRPSSSAAVMRSSSFSIELESKNQLSSSVNSITIANSGSPTSWKDSLGVPAVNNSSLSISMKYRRRIVKILFFYLLTSIICWTPLQFTIIYRHFRTEAVPANWFFELSFFSQLCASLSSAMNPIIFGFLSQPFRRIVVRSWLFRLLVKLWTNNSPFPPKANDNAGGRNGLAGGGGAREGHGMSNRPVGLVNQSARAGNSNRAAIQAPNGPTRATSTRGDLEQQPKLTIEYIEHNNHHHHNHQQQSTLSRSTARRSAARQQHCKRVHHHPKSTSIVAQHQCRAHLHSHHEATVQRSHSSTASFTKPQALAADANQVHDGGSPRLSARNGRPTGAADKRRQTNEFGIENEAYMKADEEEEDGESDSAEPGNATTSFTTRNGATTQRVVG